LRVSTQALPTAKRFADAFHNMGAIREPIQQGRGQAFIPQDLRPIGKAHIGGDDQGHPFIPRRAELTQQMRPGG
jgi:hypothetical protein